MIQEILKKTVEPERFREALMSLDGEFDFGTESMRRLGEVYCELYPESVSHGDSAQVQKGYRIVRAAISEHILKGVSPFIKSKFREMFTDVSAIDRNIAGIITESDAGSLMDIHKELDSRIRNLKADIDTMGNSVIKERFTGGITVFYNILYLVKKKIEEHSNRDGDEK